MSNNVTKIFLVSCISDLWDEKLQ